MYNKISTRPCPISGLGGRRIYNKISIGPCPISGFLVARVQHNTHTTLLNFGGKSIEKQHRPLPDFPFGGVAYVY